VLVPDRSLGHDATVPDTPAAVERMSYEQPTPEESVGRLEAVHHVRDALQSAIETSSSREQRVVEVHILSDEPCTLEVLGREMGVSKEQVRQLEVRARQKVRDRLEHLRPAA